MKNLLYYTAFGDIYRTFAEISIKSALPFANGFKIIVFSDSKIEIDEVETIIITDELSTIDKMCFRSKLLEYVDLSKYNQVWFCDPDIIFKRNVFEQFKLERDVKIHAEIWTTLKTHREWFAKGMTDLWIKQHGDCKGINGGFFLVPKYLHEKFFKLFNTIIDAYKYRFPNDISTDQQALNIMYYMHYDLIDISLMNSSIECFPARMEYNNHYIKHFACYPNEEKKRLMLLE